MTIDFTLPTREERRVRTTVAVPEHSTGPHPLSYLLALAHSIEQRVRCGEIKDYATSATLNGVSRTRIGQIISLLALAPAIQEYILGLHASDKRVNERLVRATVREWNWDRQCLIFFRTAQAPAGSPDKSADFA